MNQPMKRLFLGILAVAGLNSCNTFIGLGQDFEQLGSGMQNVAHGQGFDGSGTSDSEEEYLPSY